MFAAFHIPNFPLAALLRQRHDSSEDTPRALLGNAEETKSQILMFNAAAARAGVEPGMTATQGQARCPEIEFFRKDPEEEAEAHALLLDYAGAWTPDFESTAPGTVTLDLFSNPAARTNPQSFAEGLFKGFRDPLPLKVGLASNPDLALLAARTGTAVVLPPTPEAIRTALGPLPIALLQPSEHLLAILNTWGIQTVGEFLALPGDALTERLGAEAMVLHARATGSTHRLLRLERPTSRYHQAMELEHEIEQLDPLLFLLRRLLDTIVARLGAHHLVVEQLELILGFRDATSHTAVIRIPDPSADPELLFRTLHTHLEGFTAKHPIITLSLEAQPSRARRHQYDLFAKSLRDPNQFAETLARLEGLLGPGKVGRPEPLDTYRPDSFRLSPFTESPPPQADTPPPRPMLGPGFRRLRPPHPVSVETTPHQGQRVPATIIGTTIRGEVTEWRGPWLGSGDWWDRHHWKRREWDIALTNGTLCRLVQTGSNWQVEGFYG